MKSKLKTLFFFSQAIILLLILLVVMELRYQNKLDAQEQKLIEASGFGQIIETVIENIPEVPDPDKEKKAAEEAKRKQEEETRQFIAQYGPCRNIPILTYHHVGVGSNSLFVKTEVFTQQLDYLNQKGYTTVTLNDVVSHLQNGSVLPAKPVVLTFDDGYRDFYTNAYPALKARNLKATLFVITQLVEGNDYVTWGQLGEMAGSGLITIGNHTLSHPSIPSLENGKLKDEIVSADNILQTRLGGNVDTFAYPYGAESPESQKVLTENGYKAAVTTKRGLACAKLPFELPRIRIGDAPLNNFGL